MRYVHLLIFGVLCAPASILAAPAARVEFATAGAVASDLSGKQRALVKGAQVGQGDTVATNTGRVQLRFTDGAYVSLQPHTQFRVDEYRFDGKTDGKERGFFSLLAGGMRTITGLVGRTNKKNYQVSTAVATIGIRGTEYTVTYGGSVSGSVGEGEIVVCNSAGCANVTNGESYYVADSNVKPVLTGKKTDLPPPQPESAPAQFTQGDSCQGQGAGCNPKVQLVGTHTLALGHVVNVVGTQLLCDGECTFSPAFGIIPSDVVTFDDSGRLISVNNGRDPLVSVMPGFGNDGLIAWGVGLDKFGQHFHYVTDMPAAWSDLNALKLSQPVGHFTLLGGSVPIAVGSDGSAVTGQLLGGSLEARFAEGKVNASLDLSIAGAAITMAADAMGFFDNGGTIGFYGSNVSCNGSECSGQMKGFIGTGGLRAGVAYQVATEQAPLPGPVVGTAAFGLAGTTP